MSGGAETLEGEKRNNVLLRGLPDRTTTKSCSHQEGQYQPKWTQRSESTGYKIKLFRQRYVCYTGSARSKFGGVDTGVLTTL